MSTSNKCPILKDVVAYVDVWSSEKTANYSKPFVQQLEEMGAQVPKTFNKQVTHVVFNNGHPATWRKAKKSDVKLVSALWVGSCYDDRMHVDEELYPALDETNPLLKNKKHRCMQPKYSTERTPENDRRMKKKLDKMMKAIAPKEPIVTDVSPIIIDEENGIVYSPALKRSDYMARRLKDMKVKRENLSPTASQIFEPSSPTELKPSLGCTPTAKLTYDQSDDDSRVAVAEPVYSPDKEEGRTDDFTERQEVSEKSWLSHCCERISSPLKCPDFCDNEDTEGNTAKRRRLSVVKKIPADKRKSIRLLEGSCQDKSDSSKKVKEKRRSHIKSFPPSPNKSEKRKGKIKTVQSLKETKGRLFPDDVNSTCVSSPAELGEAAFELSEQIPAPLQKIVQKKPKQASPPLSDLVRSFTLSGDSKGAVSVSSDGDDVFEDYFSPANRPQKATRPRLPDLPVEGDIQIPFELDRVPKNRKKSCERTRSLTIYEKQKLEKSRKKENPDQQSDAGSEPQSHPQLDVNESLESLSTNVTLVAKRRRQSTLPFTRTSATIVASTSELPTKLTEDTTVSDLQRNCDVNVLCESRGNECKVAAVLTEIPSDGKENHNQYLTWSLQKMDNKTKHLRTLVMTSMPTEKQHTVVQVVKALGGFSIVDRVCGSTTHVVSSGHRRTLNILLGIARGCWVLSFEWILWCLEQRQWVPEEPYELSDLFPAAQICRLQRHLSAGEHQQDLFQSQPAIFVSQHSQPPTQSLMELIQLFGGTVCKTVRQAGICVGKYSGRKPEGSRILSEQWVLDSITHLRQLSYDNYHLE